MMYYHSLQILSGVILASVVAMQQPSRPSRRHFLAGASAISWSVAPGQSWGRGLAKFPCTRPLSNAYHLMRAGTSMLEEEGILSTNPLFLTNREDALSQVGEEQVVSSCQAMKVGNRTPTLVKYSLAARCIDTSNLVSRELRLGSDRLVPEFTFMDPRGVGAWDMSARDAVLPALYSMDYDEAGNDGVAGRPPPNEDGTPHEVLAEQAVRLRQVMSILESQYSGETILMIFPDGTSPALLSSMIAGIPYRHVHELEYEPGEVRFDVTLDSTLALWKQRKNNPEYWATLEKGKATLADLRDPDKTGSSLLDLRTKKLEEERIAIEAKQAEADRQKELALEEKETLRKERYAALEQLKSEEQQEFPTTGVLGSVALAGVSAAAGLLNRPEEPISSEDDLSRRPETDDFEDATEQASQKERVIMDSISSRLSDESNTADPVKEAPAIISEREKEDAAAAAMDDYMNRDDGANDWLQSLQDILDDDSTPLQNQDRKP